MISVQHGQSWIFRDLSHMTHNNNVLLCSKTPPDDAILLQSST